MVLPSPPAGEATSTEDLLASLLNKLITGIHWQKACVKEKVWVCSLPCTSLNMIFWVSSALVVHTLVEVIYQLTR